MRGKFFEQNSWTITEHGELNLFICETNLESKGFLNLILMSN